jgi:hypothetical protein
MPGWLVGASPLNPSSSIATIEIELTTLYELRDGQIVRVH